MATSMRYAAIVRKWALAFWVCVAATTAAQAEELYLDGEIDEDASLGCTDEPILPPGKSKPLPGAIKVLPQEGKIYPGLFELPPERNGHLNFEAMSGTQPPILFTFHDFLNEDNEGSIPDRRFDDPMEGNSLLSPLQYAEHLWKDGTVLAVAWAVYCCPINDKSFWLRIKNPHSHFQNILSGEQDEFLRETARQIKALNAPIMLTVIPEFNWQGELIFGSRGHVWIDQAEHLCNQYGDPAWPDGPELIRDVFRYVIDLFREEQVANVTWFMYAASNYLVPGVEGQSKWLHPKYFYPGDDYIDWVGQSVYFKHESWRLDSEEPTFDFDTALGEGYRAWRTVTDKPFFIPEFGAQAASGTDRSAYVREVLTSKLPAYEGIAAFAWADSGLYEDYFNIPRLGHVASESEVWNDATSQPPYAKKVRLTPAPLEEAPGTEEAE